MSVEEESDTLHEKSKKNKPTCRNMSVFMLCLANTIDASVTVKEMEGFDRIKVSPGPYPAKIVHRIILFDLFKSLPLFLSKKTHPSGVCPFCP